MELNLSREDAELFPLLDLSAVVSEDWTFMTTNICVGALSTSGDIAYTSARHGGALTPLPDRGFKMTVNVYVVGATYISYMYI